MVVSAVGEVGLGRAGGAVGLGVVARHREARVLLGLAAARRVVLDDGAPVVRRGHPAKVADPLPEPDRVRDGADRLREPAHHVLLLAECLEHARAGGRRGVAAVEGEREERDCLRVGPRACGVLGGQGGIPARPRPVVGRFGMVGQHGVVARPDLLERVEQPGVQSALDPERDRGAHGATGQLVPEADPAPRADEQTGRVEPSQAGHVHPEQRHEPVVDGVRRRRDELEHLEVVVGQPVGAGQHGVAHRRGQPATRVATDLADVEGVSPGEPVDARRVEAGAVGAVCPRPRR